ncbi:MAG: biotin/lipoyl-containing protein, partial [Bacteroidota bacterium]|nr:biotin/lipoyl-containing protein [Bacteroidota bacterium]
KILEVAILTKSDAIHPGYGFLSENAVFSQKCEEKNIEFIGPSAFAINTMGDKITARKTMIDAGVPVVPGLEDFTGNDDELLSFAKQIGYPVMVKASAGGGGKGMRLIHSADELLNGIKMAKSEALSSFGNDIVYIEKFVSSPHHIEFQVLADKHGNIVHVNERECSVQRRHQKVIEESPSPLMTPQLREKMGKTAVLATKAVNYVGAGTIEFLVDDDLNYYFLEMNTRLQVEHPITEMTSGIDLVEEQLNIAFGGKLNYTQDDIKQKGHSFECRVYAEDTDNNFMPNPGNITYIKEPKGDDVRIDGYVYSGYTIPLFYDPMISKLIVWDENREKALEKMKNALKNYRILGVKHNIAYLHRILNHENFENGKYDTRFIGLYSDDLEPEQKTNSHELKMAAITTLVDYLVGVEENMNELTFSNNNVLNNSNYQVKIDEQSFELKLIERQAFYYKISVNEELCSFVLKKATDNEYFFETNSHKELIVAVLYLNDRKKYQINFGLNTYLTEIMDFQTTYYNARKGSTTEDNSNVIMTPMPGKIVKILVKEGDEVDENQNVVIVEAMKMQSEYKAAGKRIVKEILVNEGDSIEGNQPLVILEEI